MEHISKFLGVKKLQFEIESREIELRGIAYRSPLTEEDKKLFYMNQHFILGMKYAMSIVQGNTTKQK